MPSMLIFFQEFTFILDKECSQTLTFFKLFSWIQTKRIYCVSFCYGSKILKKIIDSEKSFVKYFYKIYFLIILFSNFALVAVHWTVLSNCGTAAGAGDSLQRQARRQEWTRLEWGRKRIICNAYTTIQHLLICQLWAVLLSIFDWQSHKSTWKENLWTSLYTVLCFVLVIYHDDPVAALCPGCIQDVSVPGAAAPGVPDPAAQRRLPGRPRTLSHLMSCTRTEHPDGPCLLDTSPKSLLVSLVWMRAGVWGSCSTRRVCSSWLLFWLQWPQTYRRRSSVATLYQLLTFILRYE